MKAINAAANYIGEFELSGSKFQSNFGQGKGNLVRARGKCKLSEIELSIRFYCISSSYVGDYLFE